MGQTRVELSVCALERRRVRVRIQLFPFSSRCCSRCRQQAIDHDSVRAADGLADARPGKAR